MSRRVRALPPRALGAAAQPVEIDSYFDKVLKYIPADIVAAWVAVTGLVSSAQEIPRQTVLWVAFGIGLLLTAWFGLLAGLIMRRRRRSRAGGSEETRQLIVAAVFSLTAAGLLYGTLLHAR